MNRAYHLLEKQIRQHASAKPMEKRSRGRRNSCSAALPMKTGRRSIKHLQTVQAIDTTPPPNIMGRCNPNDVKRPLLREFSR